MALSREQIERYARHIVLREVGGPGQQALLAARVLVVGAGGLGAPALLYLAAAGVGTLGIVDDDTVALSNLQRQVIHRSADVGRRKTDSAADAIAALDPGLAVEPHALRLDAANADALVARYDLVLDGSDNFDTRYALSDACYRVGRPLVTGALGVFDAMLTTMRAHELGPDGRPNPTFRCLFPQAPPDGAIPSCAEAGVLGALAGVLGSMMALEAIREIVGFGEGLVGRLIHIDARDMRFRETRYDFDPDNPLSGSKSGRRRGGQAMTRMSDRSRVFLRDLAIEAHIGYFPAEKGVRQPLLVTIELDVVGADFKADDLRQTVDYTALAGFAEALAARHIDLIETFAERLAARCLALDRVAAVLVRIEKPRAVPNAMAGVEIVRVK